MEVETLTPSDEREAVLRVMSAASFLIFFKSYLVAPLIPSLAVEFHASQQLMGLLVPAYVLPYGVSTLFYGPLSDRAGRRPVLLALLGAMVLTAAGTATARTAGQFLAWRVLAGVATGGIIPIALALFADLFAYEERGRAPGWVFGAIAGGMAFGSTFGALLNPLVGWRAVFLAVAAAGAAVFALAVKHRELLGDRRAGPPPTLAATFAAYLALLGSRRGSRGYAYILLNGMFHSGVFTWLGLYFSQRYGLGDRGIGLALLGYGVPGLLLGPAIGRVADRRGRRAIIPGGVLVAAVAAAAMAPRVPLGWAALAVTVLSLGFDMSHPPLAGIITSLDPARRGQAMGLNAFILFTGFGLGSLLFQKLLFTRGGFVTALGVFAAVQTVLAVAAVPLFRGETAESASRHR